MKMKLFTLLTALGGLCLSACTSCNDAEPKVILGEFNTGDSNQILDDIKITIARGDASSFQQGSNIEKSFDGDFNTIYHSSWNNKGENYFPITLTYHFDDPQEIDYFIYTPRPSGGNGNFKETDILFSEDGEKFIKLLEKDFKGTSTATRVTFEKPLTKAKAIQFIVKSGAGDGQGFATCAEMEFFRKNDKNYNPLNLFTDETCSELKANVNLNAIEACPNPFYRNIALYIHQDVYPADFRIANYKAYPHPDVQSDTHKTNPYSLLDNATGMTVSNGEELIAFVGDTHGTDISLCVINFDTPGADGFNSKQIYPLIEGTNKIKMRSKGLVYVYYHLHSLKEAEAAKDIKIHFATGKVNGYFDSTKHTEQEWTTLLEKADHKYFDVLGEYAHLTFPTSRFRNSTPNGKALIDVYDKLVRSEMELMGLYKFDKVFKNRMYFNVIYTSYMYATAYHTAYNDNTLGELCNAERLIQSPWGPAHEVGHCNQTRPGLKWLGTTEVTNNIMSEYIQTSIFGQGSRIQVENMGKHYVNRYSKAWTSIIAAKAPHSYFSSINEKNGSDVFCKLVPFWQLELYFGRVLGRTPLEQEDKGGFYPEVYEHVRTNPNLNDAGSQQLEFVYIASKIAGYNLLDFFSKWGFLTPVNVEIDDYGKGMMTITQNQIETMKAKVNALGLPKLDVAIEYISDNTWELFKVKPNVVKGTATVENNKLNFKDWKNVLTFEIANNKGDLVFICSGENNPSTTASFEVPFKWDNTYKVNAVAVDGTRTLVTF